MIAWTDAVVLLAVLVSLIDVTAGRGWGWWRQ